MRCHLATAVSVSTETRNPLQIVLRNVTRPFADGLNLMEHLVAGAVATGAAVASMHPMDTVKTVVQAAGKTNQNANTFSAFFSTLQTGGIPALYKGFAVSLSGQVPAGAVKFAAFESFTQFALSLSGKESNGPAVDFACAALAFVCCSVVLVPGELMKQRLQAGLYPGLRAGIRTIVKTEGLGALYTGYRATLLRDVPYTMLEFGLYSQFKRLLRLVLNKPKLTPREELVLGGVAGGCTGFLTTPLDLAKTRLMTQGVGSAGGRQYKGILDVLVKVVKVEGPGGLLKGSTARVVWLIPFTAVFFGVHEASKRALLQRKLTSVTAQKPKES